MTHNFGHTGSVNTKNSDRKLLLRHVREKLQRKQYKTLLFLEMVKRWLYLNQTESSKLTVLPFLSPLT